MYPVDERVSRVVAEAVQAFRYAGAEVEEVQLGIQRHQREQSELWCRLIMPLNVTAFEGFKATGLDIL